MRRSLGWMLLLAAGWALLLPSARGADREDQCGFTLTPECQRRFVQKLRESPMPAPDGLCLASVPVRELPPPARGARGDRGAWTVLMYVCADQAVGDITNEFAQEFGSGPDLDVLVLRDTAEETTQLFYVEEDHATTLLADWGELDMSDASTLRDFILYAETYYPGEHYLLAMYGHGGAWMGAGGDETGGFSMLGVEAMRQAIQDSAHVDILAFTAPCLMGNLEAAYQLREVVDVYVASPESSNYLVWYGMMGQVRDMLVGSPGMPVLEMAETMVQWTYENNLGTGNYEEYFTMSALRSDRLQAAGDAMASLAAALRDHLPAGFLDMYAARELTEMYGILDEEYWQLVDAIGFLEEYAALETDPAILQELDDAKVALEEAVIAEWHGEEQEGGHGLTLYFPRSGADFLPAYEASQLAFPADTGWNDFLREYREQPAPTPTPDPTPTGTTPPGPPLPLDTSPSWLGPELDAETYALVDVDRDGDPDLVASCAGGTHALYRNDGGGFEASPCWQVGFDPALSCEGVIVADLAGDGYPELLFLYVEPLGGASIEPAPCRLYANPDGMPSAEPSWSSPPHAAFDGAAGDVDGDGHPDLVLGCWRAPDVVYPGDGTGAFLDVPAWAAPSKPTGKVALADLDADGDLDLVTADYGGSMYAYRNLAGTLEAEPSWQTAVPLTYSARDFAVADADRDGYPEIAVARAGETNFVLDNVGGELGTEPCWEALAVDPSESLAWGDLDGDGFPELCVANFLTLWTGGDYHLGEHVDYVYANRGGELSADPSWVSDPVEKSQFAVFADLDADADLDLFVGRHEGAPQVFVNRSLGGGPGIRLWMPSSLFYPGDPFGLRAQVWNDGSCPAGTPVFVVLEAFGELFFAPGFRPLTAGIDCYHLDLGAGMTELVVIPDMAWPPVEGPVLGLCVHGALTDPGMTRILGEPDAWYFGFM